MRSQRTSVRPAVLDASPSVCADPRNPNCNCAACQWAEREMDSQEWFVAPGASTRVAGRLRATAVVRAW